MHRILSRIFASRSTKSRRGLRQRSTLRIESLEERAVPATIVADIFTDTVGNPAGHFSLREAITFANKNPGPDIIRMLPGTYQITRLGADANNNERGDFDIAVSPNNSLTIAGADNGGTTILGDARSPFFGRERLFDVLGAGDVVFQRLTLRNAGNNKLFGGAVQAISANITLRDTTVTGMFGLKGGAINAELGNVTLIRTTMSGNNAVGDAGTPGDGGAINAVRGNVTLAANSSVTGNFAAERGGGIFTSSGTVTVSQSVVSGNRAAKDGGGISAEGGTVNLTSTSSVLSNLAGSTAPGASFGRGAGVFAATLNATNSTVSGNTGTIGGGVFATTANLTNSTVSGNVSRREGGGLLAANASLTNSTVSGNTAGTDGGGVLTLLKATLTRSTVDNNTAGGFGGGIKAGTVNLVNSTISTNHARHGGGINVGQGGDIVNSTIAFNTATAPAFLSGFGGGVLADGGPVRVKNTIIAKNTAKTNGQDVMGLFTSQGHNLIGNPFSGNANTNFSSALGDLLNVDPKLGVLANNGGPTRTHALLAGSLAIDHGSNSGAPPTDQRGLPRVKDGDGNGSLIVDIGAFER